MAVPHPRRWLTVPLFGLLLLAGCGADPEQVALCEALLPALLRSEAPIEILARERPAEPANAVSIRYRRNGEGDAHWVTCRFAGGRLDEGRLRLIGVSTDLEGALSDVRLYMLRRYWLAWPESRARLGPSDAAAQTGPSAVLYFLQMLVNALAISSIYVLLATAYTLVFGVIRRINLAFGEIYMLGAYGAVLAAALLSALDLLILPVLLIGALLLSIGIGALHGWTIGRAVFRPLLHSGTQAPLIATLGLAVFLQEYVRLAQGSRVHWLPPLLTDRLAIAGGGRFTVYVSASQGMIVGLTVLACVGLVAWLRLTRAGRRLRACGDDSGLAGLCGIDVARATATCMLVSAGMAALAGLIVALHYGGIGPTMGFLMGFKALVAAVLGGIGSVPGAILGGILLGLFETFWSGYLTVAYKDVAVFAVLAAVLIFRPYGLMGRAGEERTIATFRW